MKFGRLMVSAHTDWYGNNQVLDSIVSDRAPVQTAAATPQTAGLGSEFIQAFRQVVPMLLNVAHRVMGFLGFR